MICRQCGTEIADKAIVCYRCGTATTEPRRRAGGAPGRGSLLRMRVAVVVLVAALVAVALLTVPQVPEGWPRIVGYAAAAVVIAVGVSVVRRRLRP